MRILVLNQGFYGQRIVEHIKKSAPQDWIIESITPPLALPIIIDEPAEFLPSHITQSDLLLALSESPQTAQLVPEIANLSKVKAVIMPVDDSLWLPLGLQNQLRQEMEKIGVTAAFPKTFCTLTEKTTGFRGDIETFDSEYIASFAKYFGKPKLKIKVDSRKERILEVVVERSTPCGSTHIVAEKLVGVPIEEAIPQAGLHAHHYPCLASMQMEPTGETLMHISGYVVNEEVEQELKPFHKS
ncbi:DUF166 domain-containing protein [Chloroflexota bacterium]